MKTFLVRLEDSSVDADAVTIEARYAITTDRCLIFRNGWLGDEVAAFRNGTWRFFHEINPLNDVEWPHK